MAAQFRQGSREFLQFVQRERPDLIARIPMQCQFNRSIHNLPRECLPAECVHAVFVACWVELWLFVDSYITSISSRKRSAIKSRFNFPFAVSRPLSMLHASS